MSTIHAFTGKEGEKVKNLNSFYVDFIDEKSKTRINKTIAYYKPFMGKTQYFTCVLRTKEEKGQKLEWLEPIFRTTDLESAEFVENNVYIFDLQKRAKKYQNNLINIDSLNTEIKKSKPNYRTENRANKPLTDKMLTVTVYPDLDSDFVGANEPKHYTPLANRPNILDKITQNIIEAFC